MAISEEIITRIREANDIVEVVSGYVSLKKSGRNFKGLCPFHSEKTPSFMVSPEKQIYHCFGCGVGGNVFNFLTKIDNITFVEAIKKLGERASINVFEGFSSYPDERAEERKALYNLYERVMNFYHDSLLQNKESIGAREYLGKRGITPHIIDKFKIGYASKRGDALLKEFLGKNYSLDLLKKSGLISFSEKRKRFLDFFWNRIIFPIFDSQGRIVAFGGRVIDGSLPKYINSSESAIYNKRKVLYGLNFASAKIRDLKQVLVLEGYIDVLTTHQYGMENAVATLGTALTSEHINILKRYTEQVVIVYDSDTAGVSAALRGVEQLIDSGLKIKVIALPQGLDPDDLFRKKGREVFNNLLENSLSFIDYQFKVAASSVDTSKIDGKIYIVGKVLPMLARIKNEIEQREEIRKLAEKLSLAEEALLSELNKIKRGNKSESTLSEKKDIFSLGHKEQKEPLAEKELLQIILSEPFYLKRVKESICADDFTGEITSQLVRCVFKLDEEGKKITFHRVMDYFQDERINQIISQMILGKDKICENKDSALEKLVGNIKRCKIAKRREGLEKEINAMLSGEKEKDWTKLQEYNDLTRQLKGSHVQQVHIS